MILLFSLALAGLSAERSAHAFPEMIRKGYNNCVTCHVAVTGGGILTRYGRALSKEELSHTGTEAEAGFAYSLFDYSENLQLGGDVRTVYVYQDTPFVRKGQLYFMQGDLEAALTVGKLTASATAGFSGSEFVSRRHFVSYSLSDSIAVRAGRFNKAFGINLPDHIVSVKRGLGWDFLTEDYNLEASYVGEQWNVFVTGDLGRIDKPGAGRETGFAVSAWRMFGDTLKAGVSGYLGSNDRQTRSVFGAHGIVGLSPSWFILAEADFQSQNSKLVTSQTTELAAYVRPDYEFLKGYHAFLNYESLRDSKVWGLGLQAFPRPHFEFQLVWEKRLDQALSPDFTDYAYFLTHFYL